MQKFTKLKSLRMMALVNMSIASMFYLYEFFLRVTPGVLSYEIMNDLGINAVVLGFISSCFYYGYISMQIPAGVLCDRFGAKNVLAIALGLCSVFTIVFAYSESVIMASISRVIMGVCSAVALIAPIAIASNWYDRKYFSFITGLIQLLGCVGAILAGTPITILSKFMAWQYTIIWSGAFGLVLTLLLVLIVKEQPPEKEKQLKKQEKGLEIANLKQILQNSQNWYTAVVAMSCWAPIAIFSELWGVPFLMDLQKIDSTTAAGEASIVWYGIAIGSPLAGWISAKIESRKTPIIICCLFGVISSVLLVYANLTSPTVISVLLFFFGLAAASQPITFGLILDNNPKDLIATAVGFNNMAAISGAVLQALAGYILSIYWNGEFINNTPSYGVYEFKHAFILLPAISAAGLITTIFLIKETNCKKQHKG